MGLTTAEQIILIILAAALAIFIILGIIALVYIIKLVASLRHIARKAEQVVESAEAVGSVLKNASGPLALFRFLGNIVETLQRHNKEGK